MTPSMPARNAFALVGPKPTVATGYALLYG